MERGSRGGSNLVSRAGSFLLSAEEYLREEYALDALVDYRAVPDDPMRDVPNPYRLEITGKIEQARPALERLTGEYGARLSSSRTIPADDARLQDRAEQACSLDPRDAPTDREAR